MQQELLKLRKQHDDVTLKLLQQDDVIAASVSKALERSKAENEEELEFVRAELKRKEEELVSLRSDLNKTEGKISGKWSTLSHLVLIKSLLTSILGQGRVVCRMELHLSTARDQNSSFLFNCKGYFFRLQNSLRLMGVKFRTRSKNAFSKASVKRTKCVAAKRWYETTSVIQ